MTGMVLLPTGIRLAVVALMLSVTPLVSAQLELNYSTKVSNDLPRPYATQRNWAQLPSGIRGWGAVTAVEPSPDGQFIYVIHRCRENSCQYRLEPPIFKFDYEGRLVDSFGVGMFLHPHGATVDHEGNLWVTDARSNESMGHQVIKFSPDGELLMTLGQAGVGGSEPGLLFWPTDVVVDPNNGDIFVTDSDRGGENDRVVHFSAVGKYIKEWGGTGKRPGQFNEPHSIAMDSRGRLFVADRENNRIQLFTRDGVFIDQWPQFGRPSGIFITPDDRIYVADSESGPDTGANELAGVMKGIRIGSAVDGRVDSMIIDLEPLTLEHSGAEGVGVDHNGNVYGAVVSRRMLERHVPK